MRLTFRSPTIHPGLNVTVRRGTKWHTETKPGDFLDFVTPDDKETIFGSGQVLFSTATTFENLPEIWLKFEHSPTARIPGGLGVEMDIAYGADSKWRDELTVLFFWVNP